MKKIIYTFFITIFFSSALFSQWVEQTSGLTTTLYSVSAVNDNAAWICGAGGKVLRTTNGGTTWTQVTSPNATLALYNIWGISADTAVVTGSSANTFVYKTVDGGTTWTQTFTQTGGFIDAIMQRDPANNKLYMIGDPVGGRWSLWKSNDGGSTWDSTNNHTYIPQNGSETGWNNAMMVYMQGGGRTWFGTSNTRVYRNMDTTWTSSPTTGLVNSDAIWFNDTLIGMVGGTALLSTVNGGVVWAPVAGAPGTGTIFGITGSGTNWWYVRGTGIYYSANNGATWSTDYTAPAGAHQHISKSRTGNRMWAIRANGGIAKSDGPIGIKPISSEVPNGFALGQNFPNPFNPITKINIALPKNGFAKLTVYDALGREVGVLVSQELRANISCSLLRKQLRFWLMYKNIFV